MIQRILLVLALLIGALAGTSSQAHVTELAVLKIVETSTGSYEVTWELKPNTDLGETLEPVFPEHCVYDGDGLECGAQRLSGRLGFEKIGAGQSAAMFKIRDLQGETQIHTLTPSQPFVDVLPGFDASSWEGRLGIFNTYALIGIDHILKGIDHLLFVMGLMWISRGGWMLFKTITAFTLAHSVTLGAVTFGWVGVPEAFVNTMIALSIVFIGIEMLKMRNGESTFTIRNPWLVSIFFGLLHGFGFANALVQLGLPESSVPLALFAFNVGVEIGQIAFVLVVLALIWSYRVMQVNWPRWSEIVPAYAIGGLAAFWFFERTALLMGV